MGPNASLAKHLTTRAALSLFSLGGQIGSQLTDRGRPSTLTEGCELTAASRAGALGPRRRGTGQVEPGTLRVSSAIMRSFMNRARLLPSAVAIEPMASITDTSAYKPR